MYALAGTDISGYLTGSAMPKLTQGNMNRIPILAPPIDEQRAIAHILGTLDDKIELNRRMNETLEAMARAHLQVVVRGLRPRARQGRRPQPRPAQAHRRSLPRFLRGFGTGRDSEGVASRWPGRNRPLSERPGSPEVSAEGRPVTSGRQDRGASGGHHGRRETPRARTLNQTTSYKTADVLFSWSGSLECVLWAGGLGALNQHLFKVTSPDYPKWLHYLWIHQHLADFRHIAAGKATTMGHIQRHHLSDAKVVVPPHPLLRRWIGILGR